MPRGQKQDQKLKDKRTRDDIKVLNYLMDKNNRDKLATGRLESPQKLVVFYAGYIAMRRLWETKTNRGKLKTGDKELDAAKNEPGSFIYRIEKEIAHPLGYQTSTLFKVTKFKYWGKKILAMCRK